RLPSAGTRRCPALLILLMVSAAAHPDTAAQVISGPEPVTAKGSATLIGKTPLPDQVPYLNKSEYFFMGNGVAGAGGTADGKWDFLVGPDYTCPNYLSDEEISLVIDGVQLPLTINMHRARNTGTFCGLATVGDLEVCLLDHASRGEPWTARLLMIKNKSASTAHKVSIQAHVTPRTGEGRSASIVADSSGRAT